MTLPAPSFLCGSFSCMLSPSLSGHDIITIPAVGSVSLSPSLKNFLAAFLKQNKTALQHFAGQGLWHSVPYLPAFADFVPRTTIYPQTVPSRIPPVLLRSLPPPALPHPHIPYLVLLPAATLCVVSARIVPLFSFPLLACCTTYHGRHCPLYQTSFIWAVVSGKGTRTALFVD